MNLVVAGKFDRKRWRSLQLGAYKTILSSFKVGQVDLFQTSKNYLFMLYSIGQMTVILSHI